MYKAGARKNIEYCGALTITAYPDASAANSIFRWCPVLFSNHTKYKISLHSIILVLGKSRFIKFGNEHK